MLVGSSFHAHFEEKEGENTWHLENRDSAQPVVSPHGSKYTPPSDGGTGSRTYQFHAREAGTATVNVIGPGEIVVTLTFVVIAPGEPEKKADQDDNLPDQG
jgi:hypothetical protein